MQLYYLFAYEDFRAFPGRIKVLINGEHYTNGL